MDEWWLAYDAIAVAAEELQASNDVLTTRNRSPFKVQHIRGAQNPKVLRELVEAEGWEPVDTRVRIPNVNSLVERLGGKQLYGNDLFVPIRELVQNSSDAIRARRALAERNKGSDKAFETSSTTKYPGRVLLKLDFTTVEDSEVIFTVEDDGVGMPPEVVAPALLDFGTSFWKTETAAKLYPGLQSDRNFRPSGKFGLGFFSVFMLSDNVTVTTRPWNSGEIERKTLAFSKGAKGRAEMRRFESKTDGYPDLNSTTTVRAFIKMEELVSRLKGLDPRELDFGQRTRKKRLLSQDEVTDTSDINSLFKFLERHLRQLFFALDVEVRLIWRQNPAVLLNKPYYKDWTNSEFASRLAATFERSEQIISRKAATLIQEICDEQGQFYGRAGISLKRKEFSITSINRDLGFHTIDGFINPDELSNRGYLGIIEGRAEDVTRRNSESKIPPHVETSWASRQCELLRTQKLSLEERLSVVNSLSKYEVDLLELAVAHMNGKISTIEEIARRAAQDQTLIFVLGGHGKLDVSHTLKKFRISRPPELTFSRLLGALTPERREIVYRKKPAIISNEESLGNSDYYSVVSDLSAPNKLNTFFGCLKEKLHRTGHKLRSIEYHSDFEIGKLTLKRGRKTSAFELRSLVAKLEIGAG
jgi:hypothetical protein